MHALAPKKPREHRFIFNYGCLNNVDGYSPQYRAQTLAIMRPHEGLLSIVGFIAVFSLIDTLQKAEVSVPDTL